MSRVLGFVLGVLVLGIFFGLGGCNRAPSCEKIARHVAPIDMGEHWNELSKADQKREIQDIANFCKVRKLAKAQKRCLMRAKKMEDFEKCGDR